MKRPETKDELSQSNSCSVYYLLLTFPIEYIVKNYRKLLRQIYIYIYILYMCVYIIYIDIYTHTYTQQLCVILLL